MSIFKKKEPKPAKPEESKTAPNKVKLEAEDLKKVSGGGLRDVVITNPEDISEDTINKA